MLNIVLTLVPGRRVEGVMLAMNQDAMRIVMRGGSDAMELRRVNGRWRGEDNQPVDFEVLLTDGQADMSLQEEETPEVMAAGA